MAAFEHRLDSVDVKQEVTLAVLDETFATDPTIVVASFPCDCHVIEIWPICRVAASKLERYEQLYSFTYPG